MRHGFHDAYLVEAFQTVIDPADGQRTLHQQQGIFMIFQLLVEPAGIEQVFAQLIRVGAFCSFAGANAGDVGGDVCFHGRYFSAGQRHAYGGRFGQVSFSR